MVEILFLTSVCGYVLYQTKKNKTKNKIKKPSSLYEIKGDGIMCSKNIRLSIKQSNEHVLMVAPTASGKSRRFMAHNVKNLTNCSLVVNNPNGELRKFNTNKKQYIFNPFDKNSIGFNPLDNCKTEFDVEKVATMIVESGMSECKDNSKQQEWVDMAKPLIMSYFLFNWYTKTYTFYEMIVNLMTMPLLPKINKNGERIGDLSLVDEIFESGIESAIIKIKSFLKGLESGGTIASIFTVMNTCLRVFADSSMKNVLSKENFNIDILREEESVLFIEIPERHLRYFKAVTNVLINQVLDRLFDKKGLQVYFLIDEAGITKLEDIDITLSTARKNDISIVCTIQSLNQLEDVYGSRFKTVRELFKTLIACSGLKDSTTYISELIGDKLVVNSKGNERVEKVMSPERIRMMDSDKILVIANNKCAVIDDMMEILV